MTCVASHNNSKNCLKVPFPSDEPWARHKVCCTLNSAYNEKKYVEILLCFRRLFVKGDIIIGEWSILGVEIFLHYSQFFIKGDFIIGRVECTGLIVF